jgi:hypothetical protein
MQIEKCFHGFASNKVALPFSNTKTRRASKLEYNFPDFNDKMLNCMY